MEVENGREAFFFFFALSLTYPYPTHVSLILFLWISSWFIMAWEARQHPCEIGKQKVVLKYIYSLSQLPEEWEVSLCSSGTIEEPALLMCCWNSFFYYVVNCSIAPAAWAGLQSPPATELLHPSSIQHPECKSGYPSVFIGNSAVLCMLCYFELWKRET